MKHTSRGFTLIEMLVVTGIMVMLTSVILVNNSRFGGKILLESLAYEIGLTVRQAQVYGISVRRSGSGSYGTGYGLHFVLSSPTTYLLFADAADGDGLYDTGELVQSTNIERGYRLLALCATPSSAIEDCTVTTIDLLFRRPEPDAWISRDGVSCVLMGACMESARIRLVSPRGDYASVVIGVNGQVSVEKQ